MNYFTPLRPFIPLVERLAARYIAQKLNDRKYAGIEQSMANEDAVLEVEIPVLSTAARAFEVRATPQKKDEVRAWGGIRWLIIGAALGCLISYVYFKVLVREDTI